MKEELLSDKIDPGLQKFWMTFFRTKPNRQSVVALGRAVASGRLLICSTATKKYWLLFLGQAGGQAKYTESVSNKAEPSNVKFILYLGTVLAFAHPSHGFTCFCQSPIMPGHQNLSVYIFFVASKSQNTMLSWYSVSVIKLVEIYGKKPTPF